MSFALVSLWNSQMHPTTNMTTTMIAAMFERPP
jgi:hypothetical protein